MTIKTQLPNRKSNRLKDYDYSRAGCYFVTICTEDRKELFGVIKNNEMVLNDAGNMLDTWWKKIFQTYKNTVMDEYVIMPNHIHGIIILVGADPCIGPLQNNIIDNKNHIDSGENMVSPLREGGLGRCISWFKRMTTNKYIHNVKNNNWQPFNKRMWQRNYYDHVIRNDYSIYKIREYIINNPQTWDTDENNLKNEHVPTYGRNVR
jgi:putative transposase